MTYFELSNQHDMRHRMISRSEWIRGLREHMKLNQTDFAAEMGVTQPTSSRWEKDADPSIDNWEALKMKALEKGYPLPSNTPALVVPLIGFVGAATEINLFGDGQGPFGDVEMPPNGNAKTVAVEVRGDSMTGWADDRWVLYYDNVQDPPNSNLIGHLCVVALQGDRMLTKKLMPGRLPGRFDLWSSNAAPMLDQQVVWAAKISWIKPR